MKILKYIVLLILTGCGSVVKTTMENVPEVAVIENRVDLGWLEHDYYAYDESNDFFLHGIIIKTWLPRFNVNDTVTIDFKKNNKYIVKKLK